MPQTFTLDTNCIIDVAKKRPAARAVQALAEAHTAGRADVAVIAITASEKQPEGHYSKDLHRISQLASFVRPWAFESYFADGGIGIFVFGVNAFGPAKQCANLSGRFTRSFFRRYHSYGRIIAAPITLTRLTGRPSDTDFHDKKAALVALGAGRIERPDGALSLLSVSYLE
jgi:hypothetical protein